MKWGGGDAARQVGVGREGKGMRTRLPVPFSCLFFVWILVIVNPPSLPLLPSRFRAQRLHRPLCAAGAEWGGAQAGQHVWSGAAGNAAGDSWGWGTAGAAGVAAVLLCETAAGVAAGGGVAAAYRERPGDGYQKQPRIRKS